MTEPVKITKPRKKAAPKKAAATAEPIDVDRFAGYTRDSNGNWADPTAAEFQAVIAAGGRWFGVP